MEDVLSTFTFFHNWDPRHVAHPEIGHFHDVYLRPNLVKFIIIICKLSPLSEYLHNAKSILLLNQILKMSLQAWNESFAKLSTIPLKETYRDRASYGTRKKTQCATDEIDEPSTRERSSRRLIGARLLKYLLGFDRSQLREESTQSQYYPPTSLRRGIMRRNSRRIGRERRERGEQGCRDTTADDFIIPWNLLKKSVAHGGNI